MEEAPTTALPDIDDNKTKTVAGTTESRTDSTVVKKETEEDNEFDLSNISMKRLGREDIIARAEALAYAETKRS